MVGNVERRRTGFLFPVAVVVIAGCGESPASGVMVRDSAGIEIIENDVDTTRLAEWRLAEEPSVSIGDATGPADQQLFRVNYARSFPDGRIVVTVGGTEARIYDASGHHLMTIGGEGEGPGEFRFLWDAHPLDDDRVRALGIRNRRVAFFDAVTGELLAERPLVTLWENPDGVEVLEDGRFAGLLRDYSGDPSPPDVYVVVHESDGERSDTVGSFSIPDVTGPGERTYRVFRAPISSGAGGDWVWAGWGGRYEILGHHVGQGLARIVRSELPPQRVNEAMKAVARETAPAPPSAELVFPSHLPFWNKVLVSPSNWLWVRRYASPLEEETRRWDVYDPDGRQVARIEVPGNARLTEVGEDYVLGIFPDELDVERVQRFEVIR
jgi:hypothetical protein